MNIARRIERLEAATGGGPICIVIIEGSEETGEAAIARYLAMHPETSKHAEFVVFVSGFSRAESLPRAA